MSEKEKSRGVADFVRGPDFCLLATRTKEFSEDPTNSVRRREPLLTCSGKEHPARLLLQDEHRMQYLPFFFRTLHLLPHRRLSLQAPAFRWRTLPAPERDVHSAEEALRRTSDTFLLSWRRAADRPPSRIVSAVALPSPLSCVPYSSFRQNAYQPSERRQTQSL